MPYYVLDQLGVPTVPGLFLACLFSGSLRYLRNSLALKGIPWRFYPGGPWLGGSGVFQD